MQSRRPLYPGLLFVRVVTAAEGRTRRASDQGTRLRMRRLSGVSRAGHMWRTLRRASRMDGRGGTAACGAGAQGADRHPGVRAPPFYCEPRARAPRLPCPRP